VLVTDFDYHLPEELIAQQPLPDRAGSRMLVLHRDEQLWEDRQFRDLPSFIREGDCLVLNNSRVFPSRLFGTRENMTGRVEVFLTKPISADRLTWEALVRPGRKMRTGERIVFSDTLAAEILGRGEFGERMLRFHTERDIYDALDDIGHTPLPPYIRRPDTPEDRGRYQTVYAKNVGSVAAPTAGLHFTPEILDACRIAGAAVAEVTLHVGLGTFQPLHAAVVEEARLHGEDFEIPDGSAAMIESAARRIAVGTTSVRTLESASIQGQRGETDIFIYPGFQFRAVDAMLTNFHLPRSSLLMLVCAFAGREFALAAYEYAVRQRYRVFSYGDCMLIL
jgi:S-adenosylmethionine:tRNA ribosyltransferase-isomerase